LAGILKVKEMAVDKDELMRRILNSRKGLVSGMTPAPLKKSAEEGGCGVVGFVTSVPVRGRHIFEPSIQMHNRGNGKGGGIAAACFNPEQLGVSAEVLKNDYLLQIALLDAGASDEVEKECIEPFLQVTNKTKIESRADYKELGLDVRPPDVIRYFVRVKPEELSKFADEHGLSELSERAVEDEFIFRNSAELNRRFYASLGDQRAFVLSHARNLMLFKIVGYAEQVVKYYGLEDLEAQVWIAHQRYPTKGRVWHPGGAHPFIGLNEALVHNGDFANYYSVTEYLRQHNIAPQFLTDTEVSVQLFDLWARVYDYPLEYVIEALAPTTEHDFNQLPDEKQKIYRAVQSMHVHGSPDGPWFFIIARSETDHDRFRLLGITDTAMLRPQVFAIQEGDVSIGLIASEKQAIDATLHSLHEEDERFRKVADRYWNARGGSHTDGGAFIFTLQRENGSSTLTCADKFGRQIKSPPGEWSLDANSEPQPPAQPEGIDEKLKGAGPGEAEAVFSEVSSTIASWSFDNLQWLMNGLKEAADRDGRGLELALELLTLLNDRRCDCGDMKPGMVLQMVRETINHILDKVPSITGDGEGVYKRVDWDTRKELSAPAAGATTLVIDSEGFPAEGPDSDARLAVSAFQAGWKRFMFYGLKGQRFHGCGLGPNTAGVRMDLYGSSGDYLSSGTDGIEIHVHGDGQDQLGQIMKQGRLVVHGDVGQTFLYGAKGGEIYVMGNAAGRPLINAVGRPRVVINGTCLDYLAESFMAGDPHRGGGFVILNGIAFDDRGAVTDQPTPYPGSNLFSLASGGAIFVRDPHHKLVDEQLNGGEFAELTDRDWKLILPYLENNQRFFGIEIERDLLTVDGRVKQPREVYRKVRAVRLDVLAKEMPPE
jgi:glutamate synthase domain-containing protein 1/glutamate synthase domain-containing protein 3